MSQNVRFSTHIHANCGATVCRLGRYSDLSKHLDNILFCSLSFSLLGTSLSKSRKEDPPLTFYVGGEGCETSPRLVKKRRRQRFQTGPEAGVRMHFMNVNRPDAPLYWRERTRSRRPAAGACWTPLLEETETPNLETSAEKQTGVYANGKDGGWPRLTFLMCQQQDKQERAPSTPTEPQRRASHPNNRC